MRKIIDVILLMMITMTNGNASNEDDDNADDDDDDDDAIDGADDGFAWIDDEGDKSGLSWPCKGTCTTSLLSSSIMPLVQEL